MSAGTPRRTFRLDPDLWASVEAKLATERPGANGSELIRALLWEWLDRPAPEKEATE